MRISPDKQTDFRNDVDCCITIGPNHNALLELVPSATDCSPIRIWRPSRLDAILVYIVSLAILTVAVLQNQRIKLIKSSERSQRGGPDGAFTLPH